MSDLKVKELISFSKDSVYVNYLTESNSVNPLEIMDIEFSRSSEVVGKNLTYPVNINVINNLNMTKSINYTNYNFLKEISGGNYVGRSGYILIAYNLNTKDYKVRQRYWYNDSLPSTTYNDMSYIFTNPLNFLESNIATSITEGDVVFVILLGSNLDMINGTNKYMFNEDNISQRRIVGVRNNIILNPLEFLSTIYKSDLNTKKITMDSLKNKDVYGNTLSFPKNYFFNYMCKIDSSKKIITDEYICYNNRGGYKMEDTIRYQSNIALGDVSSLSPPSTPFTNNYPLNEIEKSEIAKGNKIIMGLNNNYQFNIFDQVRTDIPVGNVLVKGVDFKVHNLLNVGDVSNGFCNFNFNKNVIISETKKE